MNHVIMNSTCELYFTYIVHTINALHSNYYSYHSLNTSQCLLSLYTPGHCHKLWSRDTLFTDNDIGLHNQFSLNTDVE